MIEPGAYASDLLPAGIRSRMVRGINGLALHVLESGFEGAGHWVQQEQPETVSELLLGFLHAARREPGTPGWHDD